MEKRNHSLDISELILTRISHDLIGNIGAVSNAVELLEDGDLDFIDDIKNILKSSSFILSSRMKFFRLVFGANNANLEQLPLVLKTTLDYLKTIGREDSHIELDFDLEDGRFSKIAMLLSMIISDTFIRGGRITIKQAGAEVSIISKSKKLLKDKVFIIKEVISGNIIEYLPQYAPIIYLKEVLKEAKYNINVADGDDFNIIIK